MSRVSLEVMGVGLASSLGVDAVAACAAARAGITRVAEGAFAVVDREAFEVVPVSGHPVGTLTAGFEELGLWVRLGSLALADLLRRAPLDHAQLAETAVVLACPSDYHLLAAAALPPPPEPREESEEGEGEGAAAPAANGAADPEAGEPDPHDDEGGGVTFRDLVPYYGGELAPKIFHSMGLPPPGIHEVLFDDEVGFVSALTRAKEILDTGEAERCIVGGIDSLLEPRWLTACHDLELVKTAVHPTGFMPGEAAAFLLVEGERGARRRNAPVLARVEGIAGAVDAARFDDPGPRGFVLADVVQKALAQASRPCSGWYCDLNGETARAQEWGTALVRLPPSAAPRVTLLPAAAFGETRAAHGPLAACMAVQAFQRGRHPSESVLVWLASDRGGRGSFVLTRGGAA